jgi:hypothetical protein
MDLPEILDKLGRDVTARYPYINHGGCCVYAAIVAQALQAHRVNAKGIVVSWFASKWIHIDKVRNNLKRKDVHEWQENDVNFSHVGLEFRYRGKVYHYDSNGIHPKAKQLDGMEIYPGRLLVEEMVQLAESPEGWNSSFNRRYIPTIRRMVDKALKPWQPRWWEKKKSKSKKTCPKVPATA